MSDGTELVLRSSGGITRVGSFTFTATGLHVEGKPTFEEWQRCGEFLQRMGQAVQWLIGDWLNEGEQRYGEMYAQAMDVTGLDYDTLIACKWAASKFELLRRRSNLSFTTHREVAALPPAEADAILDRAEAEGLSTRQVRMLVREAKTVEPMKVKPFDFVTERTVIYDWLAGRFGNWPEHLRGTFTRFIGGIADDLQEQLK